MKGSNATAGRGAAQKENREFRVFEGRKRKHVPGCKVGRKGDQKTGASLRRKNGREEEKLQVNMIWAKKASKTVGWGEVRKASRSGLGRGAF